MAFPAVTSVSAALLSLVVVAPSGWVVAGRARLRVLHRFGMVLPKRSARHFVGQVVGTAATWMSLAAASVLQQARVM